MNKTEHAILTALADTGPAHDGVSLRRRVGELLGRGIGVLTLYQALTGLENRGMVRCWDGERTPERGDRAKCHAMLLLPGREALEAAAEEAGR